MITMKTPLVEYLIVLLCWSIAVSVSATAPSEYDAYPAYPLRPPDTSSPRDTLQGFITNANEVYFALLANQSATARSARRRAVQALDFSETTNGHTWDEQTLRIIYLKEILDRIALPAWEEIPGDAEVAEQGISRWTLPDTRLVISRLETGERSGEFVISAPTVANLHRYFRQVRHLPYKPGAAENFLEEVWAESESQDTIAARIRNQLKPTDASSPRAVLLQFLESVNDAYELIMAADAALVASPPTMTRAKAIEAERRAKRLIDRAILMLDLADVPEAVRNDVGMETVLLLKEIIDRAPLPPPASIPSARSIALSGDTAPRWEFPNTNIAIVRLDKGPHAGQFVFSADTVARAAEYFDRVRHLPYRGQGGKHEDRFEEEYPNAAISADFYEYYIATPGSLIPGTSWLWPWLRALPEGLKGLFFGQTFWQWLALVLGLLFAALFLIVIYAASRMLANRTEQPLRTWIKVLSPLAGAGVVGQLIRFLDEQINLTGSINAALLTSGTALIYLFLALATMRVVSAITETITALSRGKDDAERFDVSLLRVGGRSIGFVLGVIVFITGIKGLGIDIVPLLAGLGVGGLAVALAIRPTLENMIGGIILYADRPIQIGDYCTFGQQSGSVERIGLRSTRIRAKNRTLITVPNSVFADMQLINWANCDKMLITTVVGLRYETTPEQLRRVLARMRQVCFGHPMIETSTLRVRLSAFGPTALDVAIRVYALTRDWSEFHAIREDLYMRFMDVIEESGTAIALPSSTVYMTKDQGLDADKIAAAEQEVAGWRDAEELPFPITPETLAQEITDSLDWPPKGSPNAHGKPCDPDLQLDSSDKTRNK